jgi:hypothetical protein
MHCADRALELSDPTLLDAVHRATHGIGADAVIITAATASTGPHRDNLHQAQQS